MTLLSLVFSSYFDFSGAAFVKITFPLRSPQKKSYGRGHPFVTSQGYISQICMGFFLRAHCKEQTTLPLRSLILINTGVHFPITCDDQ